MKGRIVLEMNILDPVIPSNAPNPLPSPCISNCGIEASSGFCKGCWRTLDEIIAWKTSTEECKRIVWQSIHIRRQEGSSSECYE